MYSAKPNHDWSSHLNDALRTLATGLENDKFENIKIRQQYDKGFNLWGDSLFKISSMPRLTPALEMPKVENVPSARRCGRRAEEDADMRKKK